MSICSFPSCGSSESGFHRFSTFSFLFAVEYFWMRVPQRKLPALRSHQKFGIILFRVSSIFCVRFRNTYILPSFFSSVFPFLWSRTGSLSSSDATLCCFSDFNFCRHRRLKNVFFCLQFVFCGSGKRYREVYSSVRIFSHLLVYVRMHAQCFSPSRDANISIIRLI